MTVKGRASSRRFSKEQEQENLSRHQLGECLDRLGWITSSVETDMGEDLLVRIYDNGETTGLSFFVQLKSSADAERLKRKKSPALAYRLKVKDLEHWEKQTTVVVLVVWDVEKREGWWRPIPEILKDLDKNNAGWRKKTTATVTVPLVNATDRPGWAMLRRTIANHAAPLVSSSTSNDFGLVFQTTEAGLAALRQLERAVDFDETLTLEGKYAPKIRFPEWHRRLYGHEPLVQLTRLEKGKAAAANESILLRVEVDSPEGHAEYPYVALLPVVHGRKRLVLTNQDQSLPLIFSIEATDGEARFAFRRERLGRTVHEARDATVFLLAVASPGAIIRVSHLPTGNVIISSSTSDISARLNLHELRRLREILDKLCYIQQRVAHIGAFRLEDDHGFLPDEVAAIDTVFDICRSGRNETTMAIAFELPPGFEDGPVPTIRRPGVTAELLGLRIPLGDARVTILDVGRFADAVRLSVANANATGKPALVDFDDLRVVLEYIDWLPGNLPWGAMYEALDRLAESAGRNDGYFTRADARAAGASDSIFDALLAEHKIETVAADVYHLVHFPRADREDLIILWLQTERRGVVSHETALFLHDLCDVLPAHLHVTVPPAFSLRDRQLDAEVEIHRADVGEHELRWHGPVPFTAPLRTVCDCIDVGVSPELIEQAVAEGIRRGLFTEADLPPIRRAESA
jgi:hypothetical protein